MRKVGSVGNSARFMFLFIENQWGELLWGLCVSNIFARLEQPLETMNPSKRPIRQQICICIFFYCFTTMGIRTGMEIVCRRNSVDETKKAYGIDPMFEKWYVPLCVASTTHQWNKQRSRVLCPLRFVLCDRGCYSGCARRLLPLSLSVPASLDGPLLLFGLFVWLLLHRLFVIPTYTYAYIIYIECARGAFFSSSSSFSSYYYYYPSSSQRIRLTNEWTIGLLTKWPSTMLKHSMHGWEQS